MLKGTKEKIFLAKRGKLEGIFNEAESIDYLLPSSNQDRLTRSISQPDFIHEIGKEVEKYQHEPAKFFSRPEIGSMIIR